MLTKRNSKSVISRLGIFFLCLWFITQPGLTSVQADFQQDNTTENAAQNETKPAVPENKEQNRKAPLASYITVENPIDDNIFRKVRNTALVLQKQAADEDRPAFLILEIKPGNSEAYQVIGLAKFLTSSETSRVTTVAWVPETVTGNTAILPLSCKEIVLHPDALLGDIGRGKAVDTDDRLAVLNIIDKRHNRKINRALTEAMLDPQKKIIYATLEQQGQPKESRLVTTEELELLRNNRADIKDVQTIKEVGEPGRFSGSQARDLDFLVSHLAKSKGDLADFYGIDPDQLREKQGEGKDVKVRLIRVTEVVDPVLEAFLKRQTERAIDDGANLIIYEIESPGGLLHSAESIAHYIADLEQRKVRTIAYIPDFAYSGAALISLGCDEIYLRENARIGDAGAIAEIGKEGKFEHVPEKILGPYKEILRNLAKLKNRPPAIAEAMAFKDLVVYQVTHRDNGRTWFMTEQEIHDSNGEWIKGPAVPESGNSQLLTVSGERAVELKIAKAVVKDMDDLKGWLSVPLDVKLKPVDRTWIDTLIFILASPVVGGFLLFLGILCIYIELHSFTGFFAIISIVCFAVYFWGKHLGGTAGWLEVILFSIGLIFLGLEVFVIPGFGIFGISGLLLIVGSLIMASQTFNGFDSEFDIKRVAGSLKEMFAAIVSVAIVASLINRYLPKIPVINSAMLLPPGGVPHDDDSPRLRPDLVLQQELQKDNEYLKYVGMQGIAITLLRPSGKARIHDRILDVVSEGNFIKEGSSVEVTKISGSIITVRQV